MVNTSLDYIYQEQQAIAVYSGVGALLGWDQMTYMPPAGADDRAAHLGLISRLTHEKIVDDVFFHHTKKLKQNSNFNKLDAHHQIVVSKLYHDLEKARKIPPWFVEKSAKITTLAYTAWEKARKNQDFQIFAPHLQEIIALEQQYCDFIKLPGHPYNGLLDNYEEGMTTTILDREFSKLQTQLRELLQKVMQSEQYEQQKPLDFNLTKNQQQTLTELLINHLGLPRDRSRIDISIHPFTTTVGTNDIRFTTNYDRKSPLFSIFSTIHEAGHALYELGLPKDKFKNTVISDSASLGIHESQSRFWENIIGRNRDFWEYFYQRFAARVPAFANQTNQDQWYSDINQVQPSLIRVEADELTYCLHIILRYELELGLLDGKISVNELPQLWNEKMRKYFDLSPANDVEGVLQDMHWSGGNFGYFPTYAIGTIYAAQLFQQLLKDVPDMSDKLRMGDMNLVKQWLQTNIHQFGRQYTAEGLMKKICGTGLQAQVFIQYLKDKYYELYSIT